MLSRSERLEIELQKRAFDSLVKQYTETAGEARTTSDPDRRIRLEDTCKALSPRMKDAEQQLKASQRDILDSDFQRLLEILQSGGQPVEQEMRRLYRSQRYSHHSDELNPETLEDVLIEQSDLPSGNLAYTSIERMIAQLMQDEMIPQPIRQQLRTWLRSKVSNLERLEAEVNQAEPANHSCLIVRVKRDGGHKYAVSAWLMPQQLPVNALPPEDWGAGIAPMVLDTIPELIQTWVQRSVAQLGAANQIHVQVFLPKDHLSTAIEQWEVNTQGTAVWLGVECETVVVRCEDRLAKLRQDAGYIKRWRARWRSLTANDQDQCDALLALGDDCDNEETWRALYLQLKNQEKVGFYFTQSPCTNTLDKMINAASPVLLWRRALLPHCHNQWQSLLSWRMADFPHVVTKQRESAWKSKSRPLHLGSHLTLLWDDPNCLPPDVDAEFSHIAP